MLLVEEESYGEITDLLFGVLVRGNEIDRLEVTEVDVPTEDVYIQELADVFLLVVAAEVSIYTEVSLAEQADQY